MSAGATCYGHDCLDKGLCFGLIVDPFCCISANWVLMGGSNRWARKVRSGYPFSRIASSMEIPTSADVKAHDPVNGIAKFV